MREQELKEKQFTTLYLNVQENDFVSEPLVAILGEFNEIIEKSNIEIFDSIIAKAATFAKGLPQAIRKTIVKKIASDDFSELIEDTIKSNNQLFEKEISDYKNIKKTLIVNISF